MTNNRFFMLSSSCKAVKGLKRSLIIDYLRNELFFISNAYYELLQLLDRNKVKEIEETISTDSKASFSTFIDFLLSNEIGFLTTNPKSFPIRENIVDDEFVFLKDVIIEIDENNFSEIMFTLLIEEIAALKCNDVQLRFLSKFNFEFKKQVLDIITKTNINYVEIHFTYAEDVSKNQLNDLILNYSPVSHIYIYNAPKSEIIDFSIEKEGYHSLHLGKSYFIAYPFNKGKCCGTIHKDNLDFENIDTHSELERNNGCLHKKVSIDASGNIKNCPVMDATFGNIKNTKITDVIQEKRFTNLWFINKTQIDTCKSCEFRFNCTDCRAFLEDPENRYSKPLKCGYNPSTCTWEDWSTNPLKEKAIKYYDLL